jgi:predicted RNA-binding Zn-ribbon protein involved in translation (DUF1610 family)
MPPNEKFSLLRNVLKAIGLSTEAIDDIIDRIADFLSEKEPKSTASVYPYHLRDDFLTKAEHNFYMVVRSIVPDSAVILAKVSLGDLFYVRSGDASEFRTYTNKIDRKHVDFLLCDAKTMRPMVGIELDDKSHQRNDRQARDEFVEGVFRAADLPLIRFPVKYSYSTAEISAALKPFLNTNGPVPAAESVSKTLDPKTESAAKTVDPIPVKAPACPKCGREMVLRTSKNGANQGEQFWGCPGFPGCRGILKKMD